MAGLVKPGRPIVWVEGPDSISFLQGLLSQDVAAMAPGEVRRSFLLNPQGKLRSLLWVAVAEGKVGLIGGPEENVVGDLTRFKLRVMAEIRAETRRTWEIWGDGAAATVGLVDGWVETEEGAVFALGGPSQVFGVGPEPDVGQLGDAEFDSLRVLQGEPVFGIDVDESTIPQETGLVEESVSFAKGCYLGQELVARIDSRGHVNRHLRRLTFGEGSPAPGATVKADERAVGVVTTSGMHSALAMVRREVAVGDAVAVECDGGPLVATIGALR